jgi:fumarylacetoacetase
VASANGHPDFPIQNLPLGVFSPPGSGVPRVGAAIGDMVLDLAAARDAGLFSGEPARAAETATEGGGALNALFALGARARQALRARLSELLAEGAAEQSKLIGLLHPSASCVLHLPARIGDYTDFYVGIHHATNVGKLFRPDNPLLPNYKYDAAGRNGRRAHRSAATWSSARVPFATAVRTFSIRCAPSGDQRICWPAPIRRCSSHCTVPSVVAVEIGSPMRRAFA